MGDTLDIVYNPNDPSQSYLKVEIQKEASGDVKKMIFYYPGIVFVVFSVIAAIPLAIIQIIDRIKEDKRRDAAYQQALERHKAEMEMKKANEIK
jgi:hypothetical protein